VRFYVHVCCGVSIPLIAEFSRVAAAKGSIKIVNGMERVDIPASPPCAV